MVIPEDALGGHSVGAVAAPAARRVGVQGQQTGPVPPCSLPSFPAAPHLLCHPPGDAGSATAVPQVPQDTPCSSLYWHKPLRQAPSAPAWSMVLVTSPF